MTAHPSLAALPGAAEAAERAPLLERLAHTEPGPELSVIVSTRNERDNIIPLYNRLCAALDGRNWEMLVVDDDSRDGTPDVVRFLAKHDRRVRLLSRIGRRGLASAYVEGAQASTADYVAVIDADLQHDEALLPRMLAVLEQDPVDIVVGSRYVEHGGIGDWDKGRAHISYIATRLGRRLLGVPVAGPMSGFFMIRREALQASVRNLSAIGFKILIDLFASSPHPMRARELPFEFRQRHAGESKFDAMIGFEYLMLLAD
jgi:dolichol-phosphate mannosyltransferase